MAAIKLECVADITSGYPAGFVGICIVEGLNPSLLINCAADTDVEGAEAAPERAFAVNATLAGVLARAATEAGATMLHFSSTGCYGDWKTTPYVEDDELRPTTVRHRSKAAGETLVRAANPAALILRLGWVFGGTAKQRKNFVWQRLLGVRGKREVGADGTQIGCPTSASDVVMQSLALLRARGSGVFNCVGAGGPASRLEYVAAILEAAGSEARVVPAVFPRRAPVSANEAAINARLTHAGLNHAALARLASTVRAILVCRVACGLTPIRIPPVKPPRFSRWMAMNREHRGNLLACGRTRPGRSAGPSSSRRWIRPARRPESRTRGMAVW